MQIQENYGKLIEELVSGIDNGDFADINKIPDKYTYAYLEALFNYADKLDGGIELYRQLFEIVSEAGRASVKRKMDRGEKVRVTFLAISAAEWPTGELYRLLEKNEKFSLSVTNCPLIDRNKDDRVRTYRQNKVFFESNGYRVLDTYDIDREKIYSWDELGEIPDIVVHVTYWPDSMPSCFNIKNYSLNIWNLFISNGFETGENMSGNYTKVFGYNRAFHNMVNCICANTLYDYEGHKKFQLLEGKNVIFSGYSKMDYFYKAHVFDDEKIRKIWKIPKEADAAKIKKVIIAPHHSFLGYAGILSSTFAQNVYFWLYLAEKYQTEISFIFKPHPNLRCRAVEAKVFSSGREYDNYIDRWNLLPNAKVVDEADYLELFATSDAMIMDSISFLAEYMYVQKPLLYLRRPEQAFSELGKKCLDTYEQVLGTDYMGIERFLKETVLGGTDKLAAARKKVFDEVLDYFGKNKMSASEYIYNYIVDEIFS